MSNAPNPDKLVYNIGTEVPIPGGETEEPGALDVTSVDRFRDTIQSHQDASVTRGLDAAWRRIVSVVKQPGVDFGHTSICPFIPENAQPLNEAILTEDGLTFEAHSTDYQTTAALVDLVKSHFFFLKVGPELTFRFREAVGTLAQIEDAPGLAGDNNMRGISKDQMITNPGYWQDYYAGNERELYIQMIYSYSDRIRFYWADTEVAAALDCLIDNLASKAISEIVVSRAFPGLDFGDMPTSPNALIERHVQRCVGRYFDASGQLASRHS